MKKHQVSLTLISLLFVIHLQGQVGIGITTPSTDFHVHDSTSTANILLSSGSISTLGLRFNNYTGGVSRMTSEKGDLILKSGLLSSTTTELTLFEGGHIGIGEHLTNATNSLHIEGVDPLRLDGLTEKSDADSVLVLQSGGVIHKAHLDDLWFSRWSSLGNLLYTIDDSVGIGTSTPNYKLHVQGDAFISDGLHFDDFDATGIQKSGANLEINSEGNMRIRPRATYDVQFYQGSTSTPYVVFDGEHERVGIGQSNPATKLHVDGNITLGDTMNFGSDLYQIYKDGSNLNVKALANLKLRSGDGTYDVKIYKGSTEYATFDGETESLGLGTLSPEKKLDVQGSIFLTDSIFLGSDRALVYNSGANLNIKSDANLKLRADAGGYNVEILADNTPIAVFEGMTKNVGINSPAPTSRLTVQGSFATAISSTASPTHTLLDLEHTVVLLSPAAQVILPPSISCPGREYILKFTNPGGLIGLTVPTDMIEGAFSTWPVPISTTPGLIGSIVSLKSDGAGNWWITRLNI